MKKTKPSRPSEHLPKTVSLKSIAEHLGLSKATISAVINDAPPARSIPKSTKDRIFKAVEEMNYRPNFYARSLRQKRTYTIGVLVRDVSEGYNASVLSGIEDQLANEEFLYFVASHRGNPALVLKYREVLLSRGVEGLILVNTPACGAVSLPVVAVSGDRHDKSATNIVLDHRRAGYIALEHLAGLGHRRIAFFKGQPGSGDTEPRWQGILHAAKALGIEIDPDLCIQLQATSGAPQPSTPEEGYLYAEKLLERRKPFTALFAFNDVSAIGAISAFRDSGLRVPEDVSVVGFDDIRSAAFQNPRLTTVRQPLHAMGSLAASTLLEQIAAGKSAPAPIYVNPELIVRESTCIANHHPKSVLRRSTGSFSSAARAVQRT